MRQILLLLAIVHVLGCAGVAPPAHRPYRHSDVLTAEEIARTSTTNLFETIRSLRPRFLTSRSSAQTMPVVYLDDIRLGSPSELRWIPPAFVGEVRFLNGIDATTRYGMGHGEGAILVYSQGANRSR
jgi:hypothetical protein